MSGRVAVLTLTKRNCRFTAWSKPSHHLSSERAPPKRATDFEPPEAAPKPFFALSLLSLLSPHHILLQSLEKGSFGRA